MKSKKTEEEVTSEIIKMYCLYGVPQSNIKRLMKVLGKSEKKFYKFMFGQTTSVVNGEAIYYPWDIEKFVNNLPLLD